MKGLNTLKIDMDLTSLCGVYVILIVGVITTWYYLTSWILNLHHIDVRII